MLKCELLILMSDIFSLRLPVEPFRDIKRSQRLDRSSLFDILAYFYTEVFFV